MVDRERLPAPKGLTRGHKRTQRERLLAAIVATVRCEGYAGASVAKVIADAGVSRPTFYDYFDGKDDCFLDAVGELQERLLARVRASVGEAPPALALQASLTAILEFASAEPARALFLTSDVMGAGREALDARDAGIAQIEQVIEAAHSLTLPSELIPDMSPGVVIGGVYRLLAARLRRGEPALRRAIDDLAAWVASYRCPGGERRWSATELSLVGTLSKSAPHTLPTNDHVRAGGARARDADIPADRRERILYAAAQLAESRGYNATTIADITRLAGVDGRAFYAAFADKQDAFMAVHELGVQQVMSATARAFFAAGPWPERIWAAGQAFVGFLESNPTIANVGFVEAHAVGPGAVQRVEDSHVTFTIFLEEGYQQEPKLAAPSRLALEAIITCIFELVYRKARGAKLPRVSDVLGQIVFLALAPFLGAEQAKRFIDRQSQEQHALAPATGEHPRRRVDARSHCR
jgi:AcrR family transcriptional regulator